MQQTRTDNLLQTKGDSTRLSLTHFLDRKLHNSSTVPQTVPGKLTPFQSPAIEQDGSVKLTEEERKSATADEKLILGMFKQEGKCDFVPPLDLDELGNFVAGDGQGARKRKNPFEGLDSYPNELEHAFWLCYLLFLWES
ncbi:unnamed protein product [Vicia faba]|uniref:Uncharacterized protein n=1 Tax=Vicia faba TaxID=3906 RepID=A0AAV0ZRF9_VICFA|nr:unnamed protein product [Vicia faba]